MERNKQLTSLYLQLGNITHEDVMYLVGYIKIPTDDYKKMLKWKIKDWNDFFDYKHKIYNNEIVSHNELYDRIMNYKKDSDSDTD